MSIFVCKRCGRVMVPLVGCISCKAEEHQERKQWTRNNLTHNAFHAGPTVLNQFEGRMSNKYRDASVPVEKKG